MAAQERLSKPGSTNWLKGVDHTLRYKDPLQHSEQTTYNELYGYIQHLRPEFSPNQTSDLIAKCLSVEALMISRGEISSQKSILSEPAPKGPQSLLPETEVSVFMTAKLNEEIMRIIESTKSASASQMAGLMENLKKREKALRDLETKTDRNTRKIEEIGKRSKGLDTRITLLEPLDEPQTPPARYDQPTWETVTAVLNHRGFHQNDEEGSRYSLLAMELVKLPAVIINSMNNHPTIPNGKASRTEKLKKEILTVCNQNLGVAETLNGREDDGNMCTNGNLGKRSSKIEVLGFSERFPNRTGFRGFSSSGDLRMASNPG